MDEKVKCFIEIAMAAHKFGDAQTRTEALACAMDAANKICNQKIEHRDYSLGGPWERRMRSFSSFDKGETDGKI